jgi:hypothetical protein
MQGDQEGSDCCACLLGALPSLLEPRTELRAGGAKLSLLQQC